MAQSPPPSPELEKRLEFTDLLESLLPAGHRAWFQPPANVDLVYPCIVFNRDYVKTQFADNTPYKHMKRYQVTVIEQDPDSEIPGKVALLPYSLFNRAYVADNLHHDVYNVYF